MASNLSCLGFHVATEADLEDLVLGLADAAAFGLACDAGDYLIWRSRTGAEIWFHLTKPSQPGSEAREIVGLTPFFEGRSTVPVTLASRFQREGDTAFEGAFEAWVHEPADPASSNGAHHPAVDENRETPGLYPVVFDCVDFAAHAEHGLPAEAEVRFTGFAREVKTYTDEAAFYDAQDDAGHPFAALSFFPIGMFAAASGEKGPAAQPSAHAMFAGRLVEAAELTNEKTGRPYHWLLVETLGATYDVVADPDTIAGDLTPGAIVQIACWMFGRILPPETSAHAG